MLLKVTYKSKQLEMYPTYNTTIITMQISANFLMDKDFLIMFGMSTKLETLSAQICQSYPSSLHSLMVMKLLIIMTKS